MKELLKGWFDLHSIYATTLKIANSGGAEGIRTPDLIRARDAFSQLNYCPVGFRSAQASQVGEPCSPPLRPDFQSGLLSPSIGGSPIIPPLFIILPSAFAPRNRH